MSIHVDALRDIAANHGWPVCDEVADEIEDLERAYALLFAENAKCSHAQCDPLERQLIDAALELAGSSLAHAFSIPVPNTTPQLFVSLSEDRGIGTKDRAERHCRLQQRFRAILKTGQNLKASQRGT